MSTYVMFLSRTLKTYRMIIDRALSCLCYGLSECCLRLSRVFESAGMRTHKEEWHHLGDLDDLLGWGRHSR